MRMLGLIGGMSWESTAIYYQHLNRIARARKGGLHSAPLLLWSVDFAHIAALQHAGDWQGAGVVLAKAAIGLATAGAQALVICTNTMHRLATQMEAAVPHLPLIHIADATAQAIEKAGVRRPALLATRFTMEEDFYKGRLRDRHAIEAVTPNAAGRERIHRVIYEELCQGIVKPHSKAEYLTEIEALRRSEGIDGVILGCTEITMLIGQEDLDIPVFDTTYLHSEAAMNFALADEEQQGSSYHIRI